jgi:predicted DNA-binding ribbon-helix-helix protein
LLLSLGCTSIRLEMSFWDTLEEIAAKEEDESREIPHDAAQ